MTVRSEIDWDRVGDGTGARMIESFGKDRDTGNLPEGTVYLYECEHGEQVVDARGERFRVMGWGSVQGSIVIRDRNRQMYQTDVLVIVKPR